MEISAVNNRRVRVALLHLLKDEFPGALDVRAMQYAMDKIGYTLPEPHLDAHVQYLQEKGYVRLTVKKGFGAEISFVQLTATGYDLLDEHSADSGVDGKL